MKDDRQRRPENDSPTLVDGTAALSSTTGAATPPPSDSPTLVDAGSDATMIEGVMPGPDSPTVVDLGPDAPTMVEGATPPRAASQGFLPDQPVFMPGRILAQRYQIIKVLGEGGMGAVYKAQDRELNRVVALKVIRPELARNPAIVERFKQELRLSHQVTHKNVIRIYDLGESNGTKFITMEFIEGQDLRSLIYEKKKFPAAEAVDVMQQVCRALEAAHSVGVIHRDLKPQNIIRDNAGRVVVMDFGLARTVGGDGMTQTGALVGTMEYMSPEQALGKELDQRSDLFALGLIFYELLTGKMPFQADSAIASLLKRTQERAVPVSDHDAAIPGNLSGIVSKCLERDPAQRYQNAGEILNDLEAWEGKRAAATLKFEPSEKPWGRDLPWPLIGGIAVALILGVTGFLFRHQLFAPSQKMVSSGPAISLAIMPFHNASGDPSLNWLGANLSDMLSTDVGQSAQIRMVSPDRLQQVLHDLRISSESQVDVATIRRLADFASADTVVYGQYERLGEQIQIDATILDLRADTSSKLTTNIASEKDLVSGLDTLARDLRQKLAATPAILKELEAHALRPSTNSAEALRDYDDGLRLARTGDNLDAEKKFEAATTDDPNFALAYSRLALTYSNLGYDDQAERASRRAVELSDSLPVQEKYWIEANHARVMNNTQKAIAAYENLAKVNPGDMDVEFALAGLYEQAGNFDAARKGLADVVTHDPNNVDALLASGRVEIKAGNPQAGLDFLTRALNLAIQLDNQEEKAAILQATGIAYRMLSKPEDALRNYQESLAIKRQIGDKRGAGSSLEEMASVQETLGHPDEALASYKQALALRREIGDKVGIGNTLIDMGSFYKNRGKGEEALKDFNDALQVERDLGDQANQALCLNTIGGVHLDRGEYQEGLTYLQQAYDLRQKLNIPGDLADTLHDLAEANTKLGEYDTALSQYLKAIEIRRSVNDDHGVAVESESMGAIFSAQGRYSAALGALQDAVKIFQQLKERTSFTVEAEGGLGGVLAAAGRGDEGQQNVQDALNIAHEIKSDYATSLALNWMGDIAFYRGDYKAARQQYDRALQTASAASDRERILISKANQAKVDVKQGRPQAIASLKKLAQDSDTLGLKAISVECSVYLGEALVARKDVRAARPELEQALARAEKLGLRTLQAKAQYFLALSLQQLGDARGATAHYREVVRILEGISKENGSARVLERADLQDIYRASMKSFQGVN
ncbi:MAG TPA: tetratricopeptide repeat protein [Terriglobales bacterium]|nr:tetratricopeptide repeat protein [Terriglobales bacterium]